MDQVLAALRHQRSEMASMDMRSAFAADPQRFEKFSCRLDDLLIDWSKCAVTTDTMQYLAELAETAGVAQKRDAMFAGEAINLTEQRAVLHTALRNRSGKPVLLDGADVMPDIRDVLARMSAFSERVRSGDLLGATGKPFTDVINIGIGGSDLGPVMATLALAPYHDGPRVHYVSNVDGAHIADTLKALDPATTLVIVASKTFTTIETMTNAATARDWIVAAHGPEATTNHFAALSTALDQVAEFGIAADNIFGFWDWVGGRYSLWSAIGLPLMIAIGPKGFDAFLEGGHAMDNHFRSAPTAENLPMILGLVGYWHRVVCGYPARAIIPYDQRLSRLPAYLQQLDMESNGKRVRQDGTAVSEPTGPLVWGEPGTNGQHAFFQLLHQGSDVIPVEFIAAARGHEPELQHHHDLLLANCLAQSEALMKGRTEAEVRTRLENSGMASGRIEALAPHRAFPGNRPSITIMYDRLDPFSFGRLVALYEHRVFVEAQLFGINAFDQWGVELGKELASALLPVVKGTSRPADADASTLGLVEHIHQLGRSHDGD